MKQKEQSVRSRNSQSGRGNVNATKKYGIKEINAFKNRKSTAQSKVDEIDKLTNIHAPKKFAKRYTRGQSL